MNIKPSFITSFGFCLLLASQTYAHASTIDIVLSSDGVGGTLFSINGSGEDHNQSPNGGSNAVSWSNLLGGDPFNNSLENATFALSSALPFTSGADLNAITLDNDGNNANLQDDIVLRFTDSFDHDDPFSISGNGSVPGLDFSLLNPGVYTRENTVALLTLTIESNAVPLPAAAWLFGSGLLGLAGIARHKKI